MGRPCKIKQEETAVPEVERSVPEVSVMNKMISEAPKSVAIDEMLLTSYDDYKAYNAAARKENRRLAVKEKIKVARYPCKPCPVGLHPKERVVFGRVDQPLNACPVFLSNHLIHFDQMLYPGKTYDLPRVIINYLAEKGVPIWKWYTNSDGSTETRISHKEPRFTLRTVYTE